MQERSDGHFLGVGLINWWDPRGAQRTLAELKSLGLKTFLLPLNPGNDGDGNMLDYACTAMRPVWDAIEESGLPVTHHIGETPPKAPCEVNNVAVAMMVNIDGFREMFSKYIFGGILDRHPRLRVGWFEGGIAWVPPALQDAEHVLASYQHMLDHSLEHDIRYYWDTHMSASFMVDPLGLQPDRADRRRQGDVVLGLPAQREHVRLLGEIAGRSRRVRRPRKRSPHRERQHQELPGCVNDNFSHCANVRHPRRA